MIEGTKSSTELLQQMKKDVRGAFYSWLLFALYLVIAEWLRQKSWESYILEWRLWLLFGGLLFVERWLIKCTNIIVVAIKETAAPAAP
jgi:hypothetical protein